MLWLDMMCITAQTFLNATPLICCLIHCSMKSHCIDCSFFTEEPGELYTHFMNAHTKIPVKSAKIPSYSLDCFASWGTRFSSQHFLRQLTTVSFFIVAFTWAIGYITWCYQKHFTNIMWTIITRLAFPFRIRTHFQLFWFFKLLNSYDEK